MTYQDFKGSVESDGELERIAREIGERMKILTRYEAWNLYSEQSPEVKKGIKGSYYKEFRSAQFSGI